MSRRKSWRNEALTYRSLLIHACEVLEEYYPELMPRDVKQWWEIRRILTQDAKARKSERGQLSLLLAACILLSDEPQDMTVKAVEPREVKPAWDAE